MAMQKPVRTGYLYR